MTQRLPTQDEFEHAYAKRSGVTVEWLRQHMIALPCVCGDESCKGWAMIARNPLSIATHLEFYALGRLEPGMLLHVWKDYH